MASLTLSTQPAGLRPVQIRRDLNQIADLIELCFAHNMDSGGRAAVEEMRMLANTGPGLWLLQGLDKMLKGLMQGFVWVEEGVVIGNVSIYPAGYNKHWVIANVAVHPDYRGRGIAQQLCRAAIERFLSWGGRAVILQVDADNDTAQRVYYRLGFYAQRAFTRWYWGSFQRPPKPVDEMPYLTYRTLREWQAEYELVQQVRPDEQGGLGWLRPSTERAFRPSLGKLAGGLFAPFGHEHLIVRGSTLPLEALLLTQTRFGSSSLQFDLLIHPDQQGVLEKPLINYVLRQAAAHYRSAVTEHPTDDHHAIEVFKHYGFEAKRTLIHMRWDNDLI